MQKQKARNCPIKSRNSHAPLIWPSFALTDPWPTENYKQAESARRRAQAKGNKQVLPKPSIRGDKII